MGLKFYYRKIIDIYRKYLFLLRSQNINIKHSEDHIGEEKGFIYIAFGEKYLKEALISARSLRELNNEPIMLLTDTKITEEYESYFSEVLIINPSHIRSKIDFIKYTPFKKTIYLDSDTFINSNVDDIFELLDRYEFVASNDLARERKYIKNFFPEYAEIPRAFSELNSGIFGFKQTDNVEQLFTLWKKYFYKYYEKTGGLDQACFRVAVWESHVDLYVLPQEYNLRSPDIKRKISSAVAEGLLDGDHLSPRIYHAHILNNDDFNELDLDALYEKARMKYSNGSEVIT